MSSPAASNGAGPAPNAPVVNNHQPTVRVMRMYKPGFHIVPTVPQLDLESRVKINECPLSTFLLLPDSFGDIYCGESFAAYIAVVNGFQNQSFHYVTLSIRLQTTTTVIDLLDTRRSATDDVEPTTNSKGMTTGMLKIDDTLDAIVKHVLTDLGTHTLRVSVTFMTAPNSEQKSLRKFYRFNVLQPLTLVSSYIDINNCPMIQCEVTNSTKSAVYIEKLDFVPNNPKAVIVDLSSSNSCFDKTRQNFKTEDASRDGDDDLLLDDSHDPSLLILQPEESYAFAFKLENFDGILCLGPAYSVGYPVVTWCASMGEASTFRGDATVMKSPTAKLASTIMRSTAAAKQSTSLVSSTNTNGKINSFSSTIGDMSLKMYCLDCPAAAVVGDEIAVKVRIVNTTNKSIQVTLECRNLQTNVLSSSSVSGGDHSLTSGLCVVGWTSTNLGVLESGDFSDTVLYVYTLTAGLHSLRSVFAVDSVAKKEYHNPCLCTVMVYNEESELQQ